MVLNLYLNQFSMKHNAKITTNRLTLEPLSQSENEFILELVNTEGWIKFIGNKNIHTEEEAGAYVQKINDNQNITYWAVKLNTTKQTIGLVTLIKREYLEYDDIGFAFLPIFFGNGYAFEATKAVLNYLIKQNAITYILAETLENNRPSINLIQKLGLQIEKVLEIDDEILHIYSASIDKVVVNKSIF